MKLLVMMMIAVLAVSCAHKHDGACHDGAKTECGCDKEKSAAAGHECSSCDGHKGHKHEATHGHDANHKHDHGAMHAPASMLMSDKVTQKISQEEFTKLFTTNKANFDKSCSVPAMSYCGKTTKDLMVTEAEASCLWTKVFRTTRESLPVLDGSACSKMIKSFAKK